MPRVAGDRALRLEGKVERQILFSAGDVPLAVGTTAKAFVHVNADPKNPPQALSIEFLTTAEGSKRVIWGDPKAFGEAVAASAVWLDR